MQKPEPLETSISTVCTRGRLPEFACHESCRKNGPSIALVHLKLRYRNAGCQRFDGIQRLSTRRQPTSVIERTVDGGRCSWRIFCFISIVSSLSHGRWTSSKTMKASVVSGRQRYKISEKESAERLALTVKCQTFDLFAWTLVREEPSRKAR